MNKTKHEGKGGKLEQLPSRMARDTITGAGPMSRAAREYGKNSPYKDADAEMARIMKAMS